jgi:hypothetical protein
MSRSKGHHFVPCLHLEGFTDTGDEKGIIWQLDKQTGASIATQIKNVGKQTNYNTVYVDGVPSGELEDVWADVEGDFAAVLDEIRTEKRLPTDDAKYSHLISFVTSSLIRVPRSREARRQTDLWLAQTIVDRRFPNSFKVGLKNDNHLVAAALRNIGPIAERFGRYTWVLWLVADNDPDLIASDEPVMSAIFQGQQLVFPLSKRRVLFGFPERGRRQGSVLREPEVVDRERVMACNGLMVCNALRFVYSPSELRTELQRDYLAAATRVLPED